MTQASAVQLNDLTVRFGPRAVLDRFSLRLTLGEKATLTGRSGSGKTTVLRCILGFVVPDEGDILIGGEELTSRSVWALRTRLAHVAQEPEMGEGTVRSVLERPFAYHANAGLQENLARTPELFSRFLLPAKLLDEDVATLSGGEKQRVAIISALLLERDILLLDEASSALDKTAREAIATHLASLDGLTILSISHDPEGFCFCDQIIELPGGYEENER